MHNDSSQVSPTLRTCASGQGPSLGFSRKHAGNGTGRRKPLRQFKVGKSLGPVVLSLIATELRPAVQTLLASMIQDQCDQQDATTVFNEDDILSSEEACTTAFTIRYGINAARAALSAYSARGQLASWRKALPFLPDSYVDAVDYLDVYAESLANGLRTEITAIAPTIAHLNADQPSPMCWARPVQLDANGKRKKRGCWTSRQSWFSYADAEVANQTCGPGRSISEHNRHALLHALMAYVDQNGRNLTASHRTIAKLARAEYGCTLSEATAEQRVRTIQRILKRAGFLIVLEQGGHLTSTERLAAEVHHGGRQTRCGNTCDLNLPEHLRPIPPPAPNGPAHMENLGSRLQDRDRKSTKKSTYTVGSGFQYSTGTTWVAHPRAYAREHPENSSSTTKTITPSLRDWRIADALTRRGTYSAAENGPYAHLIGSSPSQMALNQLAVLIAVLVPPDVDIKLLLRGLAHAATARSTGFIALGLGTKPRNARAWMTTVLRSIDWNQRESFPSWSATTQAFGIYWYGDRHQWQLCAAHSNPTRTAEEQLPASEKTRESALAHIRETLATAQ